MEPSPRLGARSFLLALGTFALGTDAWVIAGILDGTAQDLSVSIEAAGQIVTVYSLTYAIGSPLLAALTSHWPRQQTIIVALAGVACADLVCASAPSLWILALARFAAGCCATVYTPAAYALAAAASPSDRRGAALARVALGTTAALVMGVPIGTWVGHALSWRATFLLGSLLTASAALSLAMRPMPQPAPAAPTSLGSHLAPILQRRILLSLGASLLWASSTFIVYTYAAVIFGRRLGMQDIAPLLLGYGIGGLTGSQSGGRFVDRFGTTLPIIVGMSLSALNYGLIALTSGTAAGAAAVLFIMGFCTWAIWPAQQSRLLALAPEHGGMVMSLFVSAIYIGSGAGAAFGGLLLTHLGSSWPPFAATLATVLGLLLFAISTRGRAVNGRSS